ncbi:MAG: HAD family hydrolase [Ruminococcaceae bacterium]|nr:HAD family hydrolase [Oscillospiraceae bacterium]
MKKGIIFDLDGTLWDASAEVTRSWNMALATIDEFNLRIDKNDMMRFMGNLLFDIGKMMLPKNLDDEKVQQIVDLCIEYEHAYLREHGAPLYEKLLQTLKKLKNEYSLFIVSNCQAGYIEVFLDYFGFWDIFDDYECPGRTGLAKAENIRLICERNHLGKAVYVGDTDGDYRATKAAGLEFIHAAYGYGKPHEPTKSIRTFEDLLNIEI